MERWLPVVGWEGLYEVSDAGRVRRLPWTDNKSHFGGTRSYKGGILAGEISHKGYHRVGLMRDGGRQKKFTVHSLVLTAFRGPRPPGLQTRHLDNDKLNNHLFNLEWGSALEQAADRMANGTYSLGESLSWSKLTRDKVLEIRRLLASGVPTSSLAKAHGVCYQTIYSIKSGKTWKHVA